MERIHMRRSFVRSARQVAREAEEKEEEKKRAKEREDKRRRDVAKDDAKASRAKVAKGADDSPRQAPLSSPDMSASADMEDAVSHALAVPRVFGFPLVSPLRCIFRGLILR